MEDEAGKDMEMTKAVGWWLGSFLFFKNIFDLVCGLFGVVFLFLYCLFVGLYFFLSMVYWGS